MPSIPTRWVTANSHTYNGIDTKVAVAGESAGGNLATEVALAARDQGFQLPTHELLVYPETSRNLDQRSDLIYTASVLPLNTAFLKYLDSFYLTSPAGGERSGCCPNPGRSASPAADHDHRGG